MVIGNTAVSQGGVYYTCGGEMHFDIIVFCDAIAAPGWYVNSLRRQLIKPP